METPSTSSANNNFKSEGIKILNEDLKDSISRPATNIMHNHDFSGGLHLWHPNCCNAFVVSSESGYPEGLSTKLSGSFAVVTNREESWQGLEQDTYRVSAGSNYTVCAWVGISGSVQGVADMSATLKQENQDSSWRNFCFNGTVGKVRRYILSVNDASEGYILSGRAFIWHYA